MISSNPQKTEQSATTSIQSKILLRYITGSAQQGGAWPGFKRFEGILIYTSDFWGYFWSLEAIKISTDSWDDVLHDLIIYVSRSGKFTAFYIAYMSRIADKSFSTNTVKSDVSRIQGGIHTNTPYNVTIL